MTQKIIKNRHAQQEFGFVPVQDTEKAILRLSYKIQSAINGLDILWDNIPIREAYAIGLIPEELFTKAFDLAMKRIEVKAKRHNTTLN